MLDEGMRWSSVDMPLEKASEAVGLGGNGDGQRRTAGMGDDSPVDETAGERGEYGREAGGYGGRQEYGKRQAGQRQQVVKGK